LFTVAIAITIKVTKNLQFAAATATAATTINLMVRAFLQKREDRCEEITAPFKRLEDISLTQELQARMEKITWFSGSNSSALPLIMRTGAKPQLKATGLLLREDSLAPLCGELSIGSMENGINNKGLSGVCPHEYSTAIHYSKLFFSPVTNLVEEMKILQDEKYFHLENRLLIPMLRVICLSKDQRQKDAVRAKLEAMKKIVPPEAEDSYKDANNIGLLAYQEKIQALIALIDKPAMYDSFQPTEKMDLLSPYPIVWATSTQEKFSGVRSCIVGESIIKEKILIGNGGIDFAFTQAEHLHRLRYALKDIEGITVLSFDHLSKTHSPESSQKIKQMYFQRMEAVRKREQDKELGDHYARMAAVLARKN
jgi:hypothetical protein